MSVPSGLRLTAAEIAAIKRIVADRFGPDAQVRVFGSRTRPEVRGGDLDLHVLVPGALPSRDAESRALDLIMQAMDDLRVDLWIGSSALPFDRYSQTAVRTGVRL